MPGRHECSSCSSEWTFWLKQPFWHPHALSLDVFIAGICSHRLTVDLCITHYINGVRRKQSFCHTFFSFISSFCVPHILSCWCVFEAGRTVVFTRPCLVCACVCWLESSAGVWDGDDGGAQSEQGGQEMGDQSGPRTQEHHPLQESKMDTNMHVSI